MLELQMLICISSASGEVLGPKSGEDGAVDGDVHLFRGGSISSKSVLSYEMETTHYIKQVQSRRSTLSSSVGLYNLPSNPLVILVARKLTDPKSTEPAFRAASCCPRFSPDHQSRRLALPLLSG